MTRRALKYSRQLPYNSSIYFRFILPLGTSELLDLFFGGGFLLVS